MANHIGKSKMNFTMIVAATQTAPSTVRRTVARVARILRTKMLVLVQLVLVPLCCVADTFLTIDNEDIVVESFV